MSRSLLNTESNKYKSLPDIEWRDYVLLFKMVISELSDKKNVTSRSSTHACNDSRLQWSGHPMQRLSLRLLFLSAPVSASQPRNVSHYFPHISTAALNLSRSPIHCTFYSTHCVLSKATNVQSQKVRMLQYLDPSWLYLVAALISIVSGQNNTTFDILQQAFSLNSSGPLNLTL